MKDFNINTLFFIELTLCLVVFAVYQVRLRLLHHCKILATQSLPFFKTKDLPFYYSSYAIKQECIHTFFNLPLPLITKLALKASKTSSLASRLKQTKKHLKKYPQDIDLRLLTAELAMLCNETQIFHHLIKETELPFFSSLNQRAKYYFLKAHYNLYETDLNNASILCSKALTIYQKQGFEYEQASCYLLLTQIYRLTGVFDVAETMLKEAKTRFHKMNMIAKVAECMTYDGLISFGREQYDFAIQNLSKATNLAKRHKLYRSYADINNWLGLSFYMNNQQEKAEQSFLLALKNSQTSECTAYATEMLARLKYHNKEYENAIKYVETALKTSSFQKNPAGFLENLYIKAEILFATNDYEQSKKILTEIIKKKLPPAAPFYPANAYTLLGLIYLKRNNLSKAKTLFKQAVDLEHGKNRLKGAAIDYNNLAEVARLEGNTSQAKKYLTQALSYAEEIEDKQLKSYLLAKLK